ncbi:odhB, partial [Symbiodinium sp. KB8]
MKAVRTISLAAARAVSGRSAMVARQIGATGAFMNVMAPAAATAIPQLSHVRAFSSGTAKTMLLSGMGESISEGTVAQWLKQPGDWVDEDEAIVVMDTDKVAVELRAEFSGFIQEHLVQADDTVEVGAPIVTIVPGEKPAD